MSHFTYIARVSQAIQTTANVNNFFLIKENGFFSRQRGGGDIS